MKDVEEYSYNDLSTCIEEAQKLAMNVIDNRYHEYKDEAHICLDDICAIKKAMQVLESSFNLKTKVLGK